MSGRKPTDGEETHGDGDAAGQPAEGQRANGAIDPATTARELRLAVGQLVRRARAENELPTRLMAVLATLDRDGAATTSDLAAGQRMRPQSMAATIAELAERGYVTRQPHASDGRKHLVALSPVGRVALEEERARRDGWLTEAITRQLSARERTALARSVELLRRLADA
ncbi:MAG TPA: MarR family transcriptional regulator [Conexibacter sp.]